MFVVDKLASLGASSRPESPTRSTTPSSSSAGNLEIAYQPVMVPDMPRSPSCRKR